MKTDIMKHIMVKTSLAILTSAAFMLPMLSWGAQNCDKPINDFDGLYCLTKVYLEADKELNNSYTKLNKVLNSQQKTPMLSTRVLLFNQSQLIFKHHTDRAIQSFLHGQDRLR